MSPRYDPVSRQRAITFASLPPEIIERIAEHYWSAIELYVDTYWRERADIVLVCKRVHQIPSRSFTAASC